MSEFFKHIASDFSLPLSNPVLVFALILFIILLAPILLRKLKIPGIIGLIISGIVIGPNGFNFLEKNSAIELFSTIGLFYIMFIAGLDLDMNEFRRNRYKSILFGIFTFILPLSIGYLFCNYLLGYDFSASLLIASMFATHTLVSYPIVSKLGISKNQAVAVTVGGTILTDTAVLIILAIIIGDNQGDLDQEFWIRLVVSMIIFLSIMFFLIPPITRWFFRKLESEKHAHYIFVMAVVFFSAFLAEFAGVEPIIGAFVAGLTLNPLIPHSSALMNRIEFIGNSLFIPFFLISVGMLVDISVVFKGPMALIIAAVLTVGALLGKWLAALFTQLIFRYSREQRKLIFGLSSSHAAATLAVILVGFKAGILDENVLNGTIILILVTCVVSSFATDMASRKILLVSQDESYPVSKTNTLYSEHILLPIANLSHIYKLLEFSFLIKEKKSVNPITILSVVPNNAAADSNIITARKKLEEFVIHGASVEINVNTIATIDHNPASGISRVSREIMANIIVLGWPQKPGIVDKLFGEKMHSIINNIDKNIFVCHIDKQLIKQKRIVVIAPPLVDKENGFDICLLKISKLSVDLHLPVVFFGMNETHEEISKKVKHLRISATVSYQLFEVWEDFLLISRYITEDDMLVFISAKKDSVSYFSNLENIPIKLEKHFSRNNKIIVYPQQYTYRSGKHEGFVSDPLVQGLKTIGKGIENILKNEK